MCGVSHRPSRTLIAGLMLLLAGAVGVTARSADSRPLPDLETFAAEVRQRLLGDRELQSRYTYIEHREELSISKLGKVSAGPMKVYQVYPSLEPGNAYKRLIAVDGKPLSADELEEQDRKHREDLREEAERRAHESPEERRRRLRKAQKERAHDEAVIDEVFALYDITLLGREMIGGHETVVARLEPRADYEPRVEEGAWMKKVRVRAWVSEADYQVVKAEAEVMDDITVGWGIIGRLHQGSRGMFERRKVNDEVWLPAREQFTATGRSLLFRTFSIDAQTTWSDYRKLSRDDGVRIGSR
jgi:hypothetical protein